MALITQLYPELDTLKGNINNMNGAVQDSGKNLKHMATTIATGPAESMQLLAQRVGNMTAAIGTLFVPAIMYTSDVLGEGRKPLQHLRKTSRYSRKGWRLLWSGSLLLKRPASPLD
ncbi:hypothetical protein QYZ44_17715 [Vibrio parahaemolyticus]|nr:hypothetical protein [Vibrio parahaemolyticus]MDN4711022.1 hypothetical protein [Vibrio parahaemolyticus]MDN4711049.1 hypothetical protein [Vibrio parahaemolyticus]